MTQAGFLFIVALFPSKFSGEIKFRKMIKNKPSITFTLIMFTINAQ